MFARLLILLTALLLPLEALSAPTPAKKLFGAKRLPAAMQPQVHGGYTRGCVSGAIAIPVDGPNWQAMRLSRNRRWGHPDLVRIVEELSYKAKASGWNGLLVGDLSQPRGGPMLTGHRSHQIGLDADIWFTPMPDKRMTYNERENTSAISILKKGTFYVDDRRWNKKYERLMYHAASFPAVERILVHPGVKKKLCDTVKGDRSWLRKIRPFWGHHYHFHIRIGCPAGSPNCRRQAKTPNGDGCDKSLAWWFNEGLKPKKKPKKAKKSGKKKKPAKRRYAILSDLPNACEVVLNAPSRSLKAATLKPKAVNFQAPELNIPAYDAARVLKSKPIEANKTKKGAAQALAVPFQIPIPTKRPKR